MSLYFVKFQKVIFQVGPIDLSLIGFRVYFGYLSIKRTQCQNAAEIITVYLFSRLLPPTYDVTKVSEEKVRSTTDGSESVKSP